MAIDKFRNWVILPGLKETHSTRQFHRKGKDRKSGLTLRIRQDMCKVQRSIFSLGEHRLLTLYAKVSIYYGTSQDVSLLVTLLPAFLFPQGQSAFANIVCAGISLGGHSTYLVLSNGNLPLSFIQSHLIVAYLM
jgi:hypothetical protein